MLWVNNSFLVQLEQKRMTFLPLPLLKIETVFCIVRKRLCTSWLLDSASHKSYACGQGAEYGTMHLAIYNVSFILDTCAFTKILIREKKRLLPLKKLLNTPTNFVRCNFCIENRKH